jgi:hypothetical protein
MRSLFRVNNPRASVAGMKRHLRGEPERFVCYGGYKSFNMDWNYDIWRCDAWDKRMCSVWEFADTPPRLGSHASDRQDIDHSAGHADVR